MSVVERTQLGPAPAPSTSPLTAVQTRVADALASLGPGATLAALAERLGGHPNATRQHLDALVDGGFATSAPLPPTGRGRPAQGFTLTASGRRALTVDAARTAYVELACAIAAWLTANGHPAAEALEIGRTWGATRASDRGEPLDWSTMVDLLDELGFAPDADQGERSAGSRGRTLRLRTCPMLESAREHPEVICRVHQGLVEGALGGADVTLLPFAEPGACVLSRDQS